MCHALAGGTLHLGLRRPQRLRGRFLVPPAIATSTFLMKVRMRDLRAWLRSVRRSVCRLRLRAEAVLAMMSCSLGRTQTPRCSTLPASGDAGSKHPPPASQGSPLPRRRKAPVVRHCARSEAIAITLRTAMEIAAHAHGLDPRVETLLAMTGEPRRHAIRQGDVASSSGQIGRSTLV